MTEQHSNYTLKSLERLNFTISENSGKWVSFSIPARDKKKLFLRRKNNKLLFIFKVLA